MTFFLSFRSDATAGASVADAQPYETTSLTPTGATPILMSRIIEAARGKRLFHRGPPWLVPLGTVEGVLSGLAGLGQHDPDDERQAARERHGQGGRAGRQYSEEAWACRPPSSASMSGVTV